jgi:subtilase family serine protease
MQLRRYSIRPLAACVLLSLSSFASQSAVAQMAHNVPKGVSIAEDWGRVDADKQMNLTVMLNLHNEADLDKAIDGLYDPDSPTYHQWLTDKDLEQYAPTAAEFETVRKELVKQGFSVVSADPQRFSIRVHGTAATVENAFQTELHNFKYNGTEFQAHISEAQLPGAAGALVSSASGLDRHQVQPMVKYRVNPLTGQPYPAIAIPGDLAGTLAEVTNAPLSAAVSYTFTDSGAPLPIAKYSGLQYAADGLAGAFTPAQLQDHYGLTALIGKGYDGTGETIALVEGYGYPTAEADANAAAALFGLPMLSKNFSIIYPEGTPLDPNAGIESGWAGEIALDIQSAHATAPGAKIVVVASNGQDDEDQIASLDYIIKHKVANTVSCSWENAAEIEAGPFEEEAFNAVLKRGVAKGISFQFSTGDTGDNGLGTPVGAVKIPSNSPYATAVGGTSVLNNPYGTGQIVTGWGNNLLTLYAFGVIDPVESRFFGGAGGGQSQYYAKPSWQKELPGEWRQSPDVSALADPNTGFLYVLTTNGAQGLNVTGGTSLASPIFTSIWAIADQYNGSPLGFAAPAVAKLKAGQITDVVPPAPSLNQYDVVGSLTDATGTTTFTATSLFNNTVPIPGSPGNANLYSQTSFISAILPLAPGLIDAAISFGTDSSLTVTPGWDNVTGWGEPNGLPFIQGVTGRKNGATLKEKE